MADAEEDNFLHLRCPQNIRQNIPVLGTLFNRDEFPPPPLHVLFATPQEQPGARCRGPCRSGRSAIRTGSAEASAWGATSWGAGSTGWAPTTSTDTGKYSHVDSRQYRYIGMIIIKML